MEIKNINVDAIWMLLKGDPDLDAPAAVSVHIHIAPQ
jgi:hypothetical protein